MNKCATTDCNDTKMLIKTRKGGTYYQKYCANHWGERVKNARGDKTFYIDNAGYKHIKIDRKWYAEHRTMMEAIIGRPLVAGESVHHKNGLRSDNRPENLELWVGATRYGQRAVDITCPHCSKPYMYI